MSSLRPGATVIHGRDGTRGLMPAAAGSLLRSQGWNVAAFLWGAAEATLFFLVPDVLLSCIGLRRGAKAAAIASSWAAFGAAVGGAVMHLWSTHDAEAARAAVLAVPAVSAQMATAAEAAMRENWFGATLLGPLSLTPFKLYAVLAPEVGVPLTAFAPVAIAARLPRFLVVSIGAALIGRRLEPSLGGRALVGVLIGAWLLFYCVFFALMPN